MKKHIYQILFIFVFVIVIVVAVRMVVSGKNSEQENLKAKVTEEITYLDSIFVAMMNHLNNISFDNYSISIENIKNNSQNGDDSQEQGSSGEESSGNSGESSSSDSQGSEGSSSSNSGGEQTQEKKYSMQPSGILMQNTNEVNWKSVKTTTENLYQIWTNIVIDLNTLQISSDNILKFGNDLNALIVTVKNEQKQETLMVLSTLYDYLPSFLGDFSSNKKLVNVMKTKANVLRAYQALDNQDWETIQIAIRTAQTDFLSVMNEANEEDGNSNSLSKIYVYLNDLNSIIPLKDRELFLVKYRNLCEELNIYQERL